MGMVVIVKGWRQECLPPASNLRRLGPLIPRLLAHSLSGLDTLRSSRAELAVGAS